MTEPAVPTPASAASGDRRVVASFTTYADAQRAVDRLSDQGFPVKDVTIVGQGLSTVETVIGRMTKGRAAIGGAGAGAWLGLLMGLLVGIFVPDVNWLGLVLASLAMGAVWGALFGFVAHSVTKGERDFTSTQSLAAERYDVVVAAATAAEAARILAAMS